MFAEANDAPHRLAQDEGIFIVAALRLQCDNNRFEQFGDFDEEITDAVAVGLGCLVHEYIFQRTPVDKTGAIAERLGDSNVARTPLKVRPIKAMAGLRTTFDLRLRERGLSAVRGDPAGVAATALITLTLNLWRH